jgi:phosphoesterase RecJ-like protein
VITTSTTASTRDEVLVALREGERFVLVTHENPDGDALGSLVAMQGVMRALGKDSVMFIARDEFPLPYEYAFFEFDGLVSDVPADVAQRTIVFLDCGNFDRNAIEVADATILNIDHHHDNTQFGTVNHVVPEASCTAEIVWDLLRALHVPLTEQIAEALYVGLVTDTGRFMYENTGPAAHVMAADLIEAGVDVHEIYRRLYEGVPEPKLALLTRALSRAQRFDGGRLMFARLTREDFAETGAEESYT